MKEKREQLYEGIYLINSALSDEVRHKLVDKIKESIQEKGGKVHKMFDQGRKKLAYEISKKKEGHYILLFFSITTDKILKLWREYRLNEDLLRFMTLAVESVPEKIEFRCLPE